MIHAATVYAIDSYDIKKRKGETITMSNRIIRSCKDFLQVHESIKDNPNFKGYYGVDSVQEMVAELSNPAFVKELKQSYPSAWHKILEGICELFGINKTFTNYDKIKKAVDRILADPDYSLAQSFYEKVRLSESRHYLDESQYYDANSDVLHRVP